MSLRYPVTERFSSLQGEGDFCGKKAFFVRFHFCHLTCQWCDTKYTWYEKSGEFEWIEEEDLKKIISEESSTHIILTGGEPSMFQLDRLLVKDKIFHIETNGENLPNAIVDRTLKDGTRLQREAFSADAIGKFHWVVSPKLKFSGEKLKGENLAYWNSLSSQIFKFVISNINDLKEVVELVSQYHLDKQKIYISLEGRTLDSQLKPELVELILEAGFNFSPRLHVMLWGDKRAK